MAHEAHEEGLVGRKIVHDLVEALLLEFLSLLPGPVAFASKFSSTAFLLSLPPLRRLSSTAFIRSLIFTRVFAFTLALIELIRLLHEVLVLLEALWRHPGAHVIHPGVLQLAHLFCGQRAVKV